MNALTHEFSRRNDYPLFVATLDEGILVLCGANPELTVEAARETARMLLDAADRLATKAN